MLGHPSSAQAICQPSQAKSAYLALRVCMEFLTYDSPSFGQFGRKINGFRIPGGFPTMRTVAGDTPHFARPPVWDDCEEGPGHSAK